MAEDQMAWDQVDACFGCVIRAVQTHQAGAFGPRQDYQTLRISLTKGPEHFGPGDRRTIKIRGRS